MMIWTQALLNVFSYEKSLSTSDEGFTGEAEIRTGLPARGEGHGQHRRADDTGISTSVVQSAVRPDDRDRPSRQAQRHPQSDTDTQPRVVQRRGTSFDRPDYVGGWASGATQHDRHSPRFHRSQQPHRTKTPEVAMQLETMEQSCQSDTDVTDGTRSSWNFVLL